MIRTQMSIILLCILAQFSCGSTDSFEWTSDHDLSIMSFNIRYDEEEDGNNKWSNRKEACIQLINTTKPAIFGIQEGLNHQVDYFQENLSQYDYVGVGRDNGSLSGEYAAIFYDTDRFQVVESNTFWLSETPDIPSRGWDANNIRIVTWAHLKDRQQEDRSVFVFNTHFDHLGRISQKESAKLLMQKIHEIAPNDAMVTITGDFNVLISNKALFPITKDFFSARRFADYSDNTKSYNAWNKWFFLKRNIDFIFYKNAHALSFRTLDDDYGVPFISDHYPIITHFNYK